MRLIPIFAMPIMVIVFFAMLAPHLCYVSFLGVGACCLFFGYTVGKELNRSKSEKSEKNAPKERIETLLAFLTVNLQLDKVSGFEITKYDVCPDRCSFVVNDKEHVLHWHGDWYFDGVCIDFEIGKNLSNELKRINEINKYTAVRDSLEGL